MRKLLLGLIVSFPLAAAAQEAAPQLQEDPRAARIREVERGFFIGFEVGYLGGLSTNAPPGLGNGFVTGLDVGYDVTSRVALSIFALGSNNQADPGYGAFDVLAAGADVRLLLAPLLSDANGVERLFVYAHGRAGFVWSYPYGLFANRVNNDRDLLLGGGLGLEYFTHLRHFSVGLAADILYVKDAKVSGLAIAPTVRYTF